MGIERDERMLDIEFKLEANYTYCNCMQYEMKDYGTHHYVERCTCIKMNMAVGLMLIRSRS